MMIELTMRPQRNLPARGFRPAYLLLGMGVMMTYGFYKVGKGIREQKYALASGHASLFVLRVDGRQLGTIAKHLIRSELAREKMWSRIHLIPMLTAEEDRDLVRRHLADQAREKELLGSSTSAYNSDRYVSLRFGDEAFCLMKHCPPLSRKVMVCLANPCLSQIRTTDVRSHARSAIEIEGYCVLFGSRDNLYILRIQSIPGSRFISR